MAAAARRMQRRSRKGIRQELQLSGASSTSGQCSMSFSQPSGMASPHYLCCSALADHCTSTLLDVRMRAMPVAHGESHALGSQRLPAGWASSLSHPHALSLTSPALCCSAGSSLPPRASGPLMAQWWSLPGWRLCIASSNAARPSALPGCRGCTSVVHAAWCQCPSCQMPPGLCSSNSPGSIRLNSCFIHFVL